MTTLFLRCVFRTIFVALIAMLSALPALAQDTMLIFAAASLKESLDAVNAAWAQQGGAKAVVSYAASSALAKQIEGGAPAQVFISADLDWMDYVEKRNLIQAGTRKNILGNKLVLVAPLSSKAQATIAPGFPLAQLLGPSGRLALGDPQHVPAGKYAHAALEKIGVWDSVSNRIAAAESVRAALALVARDEAPLGIVYETDAKAEPKVRVVAAFGEGLHPPVIYPAALLKDAKAPAAAYLAFISSPQSKALFQRYGFTPLN
jgi:molybdate transport system substrate-binding protein